MSTILAPTNSPPTPPSAAVGDALPAVTVTSSPVAWNPAAVLTLTCQTPPAPAQRSYALLRFSPDGVTYYTAATLYFSQQPGAASTIVTPALSMFLPGQAAYPIETGGNELLNSGWNAAWTPLWYRVQFAGAASAESSSGMETCSIVGATSAP